LKGLWGFQVLKGLNVNKNSGLALDFRLLERLCSFKLSKVHRPEDLKHLRVFKSVWDLKLSRVFKFPPVFTHHKALIPLMVSKLSKVFNRPCFKEEAVPGPGVAATAQSKLSPSMPKLTSVRAAA